nr:transposase domain-containing protein [Oceaniglobus trochenteri]
MPGMPTTKRRVNALADREGWQGDARHARRRSRRGGGWEYHWMLLPLRARQWLLRAAEASSSAPAAKSPVDAHAYFDSLPETHKARARERLAVLQQVEALQDAGLTKQVAIEQAALSSGASVRAIWNWYGMVAGQDAMDWLMHLAPQYRNARRTDRRDGIDPTFFAWIKGDYLRREAPAFAACYRRAVRYCQAQGIEVPPRHTALRRLKAEVPRVTMVYAREGEAGLQRCYPPQVRDRTSMVAMEGVNADCHRFDVFVRWPGEKDPSRAQIIAFQDIFSGKILSWRIDHTPNKVMVMAAFVEMVENWGVPKHCLFDNGREFANKWMTGGAKTRFRFRILDDDPAGILELLQIKIHWATPGHGQAKPIERAFRDFAEDIAKDPRFAGAYVGNRPDAKPENYGNRAIPIDEFVAVVGELIDAHNARMGRLSPTVKGASFDEAFAKSYEVTKVKKLSGEQKRLLMMGQEARRLHRSHGRLTLFDNVYYDPWMVDHAGQRVVVRFDPEQLHGAVHIYSEKGEFLGSAACEQKVGFFDVTEAHAHGRRNARIKRAERALEKELNTVSPRQLAADMRATAPEETARPEAKVVQMARSSKPLAPPKPRDQAPVRSAEQIAAERAVVLDLAIRRERAPAERPRERFKRALECEARVEAGEPLSPEDAEFLRIYQQSAEYRAERTMYENFGDGMFAG